jgi:hypothetical protein
MLEVYLLFSLQALQIELSGEILGELLADHLQ